MSALFQYPPQIFENELRNKDKSIFDYPPRANIVAGNGIYTFTNNGFVATIAKTNVSWYQNNLEDIQECVYIRKRLPLSIYEDIITIFYKISHLEIELLIDVYYLPSTDDFFIDLPLTQSVSKTNIKYDSDLNLIEDISKIHIMQVHYHNNFKSTFSETDNKDEKNKPFPCIYGILAKIKETTSVYNCEHNFRIWNGHEFVYLELTRIFDVPTILINKKYPKLDRNIKLITDKWKEAEKFKKKLKKRIERYGHVG